MEQKISTYFQGKELNLKKMMQDSSHYINKIIDNQTKGILSKEEKEEIVSDVFLTVWHNREKLDKEKELFPYIAGITKKIVSHNLRDQKRRIETISLEEEEIQSTENVELIAEQEMARQVISEELKGLKEQDYQIFTKYYFFNQSIQEIAKEMKLSEGNVKAKLHRIRKRLKSRLEAKQIKALLFTILFLFLLSGIVIGVILYQKNIFGGNASPGAEKAIQNGYISEGNDNFIESNDTKITVDEFLMDDISLYVTFTIRSEDIRYISNTKVELVDLFITDEAGNLIFCNLNNYQQYENYCKLHNLEYDQFFSNVSAKSYGIQILDHTDETTKIAYTINCEDNPHSEKLYFHLSLIKVENISFEDGDFSKPNEEIDYLSGEWDLEVDVPEDMVNRETVAYEVIQTSDEGIKVENAYTGPTGTTIKFLYQKEENGESRKKMSQQELENYINEQLSGNLLVDLTYPYIETASGKKFTAQRRSDGDGWYSFDRENNSYQVFQKFTYTIYDIEEEITVYYQLDDEILWIKLKKQ